MWRVSPPKISIKFRPNSDTNLYYLISEIRNLSSDNYYDDLFISDDRSHKMMRMAAAGLVVRHCSPSLSTASLSDTMNCYIRYVVFDASSHSMSIRRFWPHTITPLSLGSGRIV